MYQSDHYGDLDGGSPGLLCNVLTTSYESIKFQNREVFFFVVVCLVGWFLSFVFLGLHPWHVEVLGLGV